MTDVQPHPAPHAGPGPAPEQSREAVVDGIPMRWEEHGPDDGPAVVMVHGIPTNPRLWRHVIPRLEGVRCLAWELVGFGFSSDAGKNRDISVQAQGDYLLRWMDHLGLDRVVFVGHDLGGGVVQRVAALHPDRVAGIMLTDCVAYDNWPVAPVKAAKPMAPVIARVPRAALKPLFVGALMSLGHDSAERRRESIGLHWEAYDRPGGPRAFARQVRHLTSRDTQDIAGRLPELRRAGKPARVVWAGADLLSTSSGKRLAQDLGAEFRFIERARHFTPEDHPDEVAGAVREVLAAAA